MIQRYRAFYEGKMYGVKAVIWTSRGLYVTLDEGNKAGRRVHGAVLMQSTGLFDVNGKEVYIGDIVKCTRGCPHEVIFLKEYGGNFIGGMPAIYLSDIREGYAWTEEEEIIGNIYENPELIEEVNNVDD